MKNKKTLKHLPLIIAVFMLIATISAGSNVFAEQMSIFENYENRGTNFITNVGGRILGTNKEIKNPFDTYILETQTYIITAHPNGVAEIISKTLNPERDIIMVELPENMSIDEYINNNP